MPAEVGERQRAEALEQLDRAAERAVPGNEMLRLDTKRRRAPDRASYDGDRDPARRAAGQRHCRPGRIDRSDRHRQQIHRRRAHRLRHRDARRRRIQVHWRAGLLDTPGGHDNDAVGERHRLDLVVGDIDHRQPERLMQPGKFVPHPHPQPRVEVRQRLVKQQHGGVADDGAADRHPLPLPARQLARPPVEQRGQVERVGDRGDLGGDRGLAQPGDLERKGDVPGDGQMRVERVRLEHHRDVARRRAQCGNVAVADVDHAGRRLLEPGEQP